MGLQFLFGRDQICQRKIKTNSSNDLILHREEAVYQIQHLNRPGGTVMYIPVGVWLTGPLNLTSHMTLFLARGAVIRVVQDTESWLKIDPLPSYGRGCEILGGRYMSLIHGDGLNNVIITGDNTVGAIDIITPTFPARTSHSLFSVSVISTTTPVETQLYMGEQTAGEAGRRRDLDVLKSIVYGGLIETITRLSTVSSAAGGEASTCL